MSSNEVNAELIQAANDFAAAAKSFTGDASDQMKLLKQADKLRLLVETPSDTVIKHWEATNLLAALNLLIESGAFEKMPKEGPIKVAELAALVGIEKSAIARALRMAVMNGIGEEPESNSFAHNAKSRIYLPGGMVDLFRICIVHMDPFLKLPKYFKTHTQDDLYDLKKSPYAYGVGLEGLTYYEAISNDPDILAMFNMTMSQMEHSVPVLGMFPWASLKSVVEKEPERAFLVDIGGGRGHASVAIQQEAPSGFGAKMILQDRPDVVSSLAPQDIPNIEKMPYDFFTPQPIKNAHVYLLRRILHDFYDPVCIQILKIIAEAMGPTSRLIIAEMILPDKTELGGDMNTYWNDFTLMLLNGTEKSKADYVVILDAAGLEIVKIWPYSFGNQTMIECRLKAV